jgi:type IV secretory pathway TrbL component
MKTISRHKWYRMMSAIAFIAVFTAGCATTEKRDMAAQLAVARTAVADAVNAGAPEFASVELKAAQENLDAAEKAAGRNDYKSAKRLGEKAQINAQLASAKTRAAKAQKAVDALRESDRALRDEMNRISK